MDASPRRRIAARIGVLALAIGALALGARADLPLETIGRVESLATPLGPHWVWASDAVTERMALVDLETERMLGVIDGGWGLTRGYFPTARSEIYVPETHYSRGSRGERTDVVTIYDAVTLRPVAEVWIPPKRAINPLPSANAALSDDDRFLAVFNMTPATSLSIVDVERRALAGEIATPGCSLAYGAGPRRFLSLCADGALLTVDLDDSGKEAGRARSAPFFDPVNDPVTEKAVRWGDTWLFVSFEGMLHPVDISGETPRPGDPWSLLDASDREGGWRIGGRQHLAIHQKKGRLYSLVHQGGVDTHKDPGTELWIYDLAKRIRIERVTLRSPGFTYLGVPLEFGEDWPWPFNQLYDWLLAVTPNLGISEVQVTQDDEPMLITASEFSGTLVVYDALSGEFIRRVTTGNMTNLILTAPWGAATVQP